MTFPTLSTLFEHQVNSFVSGSISPNLKTIQLLKNSVKSAKMSKNQPEDLKNARETQAANQNSSV